MSIIPVYKAVEVKKLVPYARNARTHSTEQVQKIANSISEFGFINPVIIDGDKGIIAGHGRVMAAELLGMEQVPCLHVKHLSEAQKRAYIIADNKLALDAGWDDEILKIELAEIAALDFDVSITGFCIGEIGEPKNRNLGDEDSAPPAKKTPVSLVGDIWILGQHRLMCGDSLSKDVDDLMQGKKSGLVFTDLPYGVSYQSGMRGDANGGKFDVLKNDNEILNIKPILDAYMGEDTAAFVWTSHHVYPEWRAMLDEGYKQTIIWSKGGGGMGDLTGQYALDYEMALFIAKGRPEFRGRRGMAVWDIKKDAGFTYVHPTQKPVALAERGINDFSDNGALVLDLFGGSGSTLIACEKLNRRARVMELDPIYVDVIVNRWQEYTGEKAKLESNGKTFLEVENERKK